MTNAKNTKRALLMSVLSMMLCMAMLVGSTFAWFTDSVTSGKNKIVAGNLDVELYHTNSSATDEMVNETTSLFVSKDGTAIDWEPGVMVYENFTVKNVGSLALKYRLTVNVGDYNTVKDTDKSLKDVLKVAILDEAFTGDRSAAQALTFNKTVADFEKDGAIAAGAANDTYAIVIYWEPSANDNDYNLNNGKESSDGEALFIDLGVNLFATQNTVESDSFGKDYDENAWSYPVKAGTANDLQQTVSDGKDALLSGDISVDYTNSQTTPFLTFAGDQTVDLGGKNITITSDSGRNGIKGAKGTNAVIKDGTLTMNKGYGSSYPIVYANGGTVTLQNMTVTNTTKSGVAVSAGSDGGAVEIYGSTIEGGAKYSDAVFCGSQASVLIQDSTVIGCIRAANNGHIEINGGDYTQATFESDSAKDIVICNGLFNFDPSTSSEVKLADSDNTRVTYNGDGTWSVATLDNSEIEDPFA